MTRNQIDCGAAGQLYNQCPQAARRRGSPCTSMPAPQRLLSEDNETHSIDVSVPGTKPISRSAQKPAGDLSRSLREITRDTHEKNNQAHDAGRPHGDYRWSATTSQLDGTSGGFPSNERRSWTCAARVVPPVPPYSWKCAKAQRAVQQATPGMIARMLYPWRRFDVCPIRDRRGS
jgi:hypothetical protein